MPDYVVQGTRGFSQRVTAPSPVKAVALATQLEGTVFDVLQHVPQSVAAGGLADRGRFKRSATFIHHRKPDGAPVFGRRVTKLKIT